jgi:hypothetical protein
MALPIITLDPSYIEKINSVYCQLSTCIKGYQPTQEFIDGLLKAINIKNLVQFKIEMNRLRAFEANRQSYLKVVHRQSQDTSISPELHHPHPAIAVTPPPTLKEYTITAPHNTPVHRPLQEHSLDISFALSNDDDIMDEEMYEEAWEHFDLYQYTE